MNPSGQRELFGRIPAAAPAAPDFKLHATLHYEDSYVVLVWLQAGKPRPLASTHIRVRDEGCLEWITRRGRKEQTTLSYSSELVIRDKLKELEDIHPITNRNYEAVAVTWPASSSAAESRPCPPLPPDQSPWDWLAGQIRRMVRLFARDQGLNIGSPWMSLSEERREAELARLRQNQQAALLQQLERDQKRVARELKKAAEQEARQRAALPAAAQSPLPPVPVRFEFPNIALQETTLPLADLNTFKLQEKAALWWVSNQTDSLLCLPYCHIERLEYQVRTALRVLGPLRGRALLSDEVGLGKTIEAGLVLKELLTRGMVKRFLVLTVPSLVDQWEEELSEKFGLAVATTNGSRAGEGRFWEENPAIVASLHTLKQPAQLEVARQVKWDMLVVDEAHYLRNRDSQAWQAVSILPRQFLLLLTATPVQNSLEELYNLVTLLQPGQLPPPGEFRKRFLDPKRPRQPREPEELRRLLGQVMIRNTRANAGLKLPPAGRDGAVCGRGR